MIEQSLQITTGSKHSRSVPPSPIVAHYLAGTFLTLLKWWLTADMPYSPEEMDEFFQQLALPGPVGNYREQVRRNLGTGKQVRPIDGLIYF
jgi:hypothetical protein